MSEFKPVRAAALTAKQAALKLQGLSSEKKNDALRALIEALQSNKTGIFAANARDLAAAEKEQLSAPLVKRLVFNEQKLDQVIRGLESLIGIGDPVGKTLFALELDKGLELYKVTCPIGLIGIIFESRPDALVQIGSLALKSGNAVLLKGGHEAQETNQVLARILSEASVACGFPAGWLHLLETRSDVIEMLGLDGIVDLIIPRGSNQFVRYIMDNTSIPVLGHADGICHLYVDDDADVLMAVRLTVDSKCQYVAVCNALETLLVHTTIAPRFLPAVQKALAEHHVEIRGCEKTRKLIDCAPATEKDWRTEYLDSILSIKVVENLAEAIDHINAYGSRHTDAIVTNDRATANVFLDNIDSANVFWNASTRFSDGYIFGLGAEVGISTSKIHARGPVGMEGLLIYKWKLMGNGQIAADYYGKDAKRFTHKKLDRPFPIS
jgi:glutamate-5-semialdehyde dehydrogenase